MEEQSGAQIPHELPPGKLNFVPWHLIFVGPCCGTCFMSPVWHPGFSGGCQVFGKICVHLTQMNDVWKMVCWKKYLD
jgi:hypothetical protein